ncbi:HS12B-like protein [Mya arenaria]|uniref:HS12B-like protein n=1 Tax=Mya arenaria TaxID=6604 RepID=A0ABY7FZ20_MYAAR|nr:HS12B-like protein [Mya arenaria]
MVLHNNKTLSRTTTVKDIEGNSHQALPIFSMAIKFLQTHLLQTVANQKKGVLEKDICYVITVPAIWDDNAKEFMRTAVKETGIDETRVTLALEPEAASIWCETLDVDTRASLAGTGTQYMVIDLGGGTADISIQEKEQGGTLKEIHKPTGGPWGGTYVDAKYLKFLEHIFGNKAITSLKTEEMADYFDVIREFETKKRTFSKQTEDKFTFKISATTRKQSERFTGQNLEQRICSLGYGDSVIVKGGDKLRVKPDIVRSWFDGPLNNLVDHVKTLLKEPKLRAVQTVVAPITIYRTTAENPVYVTDPGCELLGKLVVELPRHTPLSELDFDTTFMFGGTELVVKNRVRKTGEEQILKLNCLK